MSEIRPTVQEIDIVFGKLINLIYKVYEDDEERDNALNCLTDAQIALSESTVQ